MSLNRLMRPFISREMRIPGKCDFPGKFEFLKKIQFPRNVTKPVYAAMYFLGKDNSRAGKLEFTRNVTKPTILALLDDYALTIHQFGTE